MNRRTFLAALLLPWMQRALPTGEKVTIHRFVVLPTLPYDRRDRWPNEHSILYQGCSVGTMKADYCWLGPGKQERANA
jgi:hypothetical protein